MIYMVARKDDRLWLEEIRDGDGLMSGDVPEGGPVDLGLVRPGQPVNRWDVAERLRAKGYPEPLSAFHVHLW